MESLEASSSPLTENRPQRKFNINFIQNHQIFFSQLSWCSHAYVLSIIWLSSLVICCDKLFFNKGFDQWEAISEHNNPHDSVTADIKVCLFLCHVLNSGIPLGKRGKYIRRQFVSLHFQGHSLDYFVLNVDGHSRSAYLYNFSVHSTLVTDKPRHLCQPLFFVFSCF